MNIDLEDQSVLLRKIEQHRLREQNLSSLPSLEQTSDYEGSDDEEEKERFEALRRRNREAREKEENDKENRGDLQNDVSPFRSLWSYLASSCYYSCRIWRPQCRRGYPSSPSTVKRRNHSEAPPHPFSQQIGSWMHSDRLPHQPLHRINCPPCRMNPDLPATAFL